MGTVNPFQRIRESFLTKNTHPAAEFSAILNRERDRADRTGHEFSAIVFEGCELRCNFPTTRKLVTLLLGRIRSTDDIGWLEDGRLSVVLPHTSPVSAWTFVDAIRRSLDEATPCPDCVVYTYPSLWGGNGGNGTAGKERRKEPTSARTGDNRAEGRPSGVQAREKVREEIHPVEELESNYLHRIPAWKRAIDIAGSLAAMVVLSPLLMAMALLIKAVSPGPVFFRQERAGYLGRPFTLWKFRTMHVDADTTVHKNHLHDLIRTESRLTKLDNGRDRRIIPFGGVIRASGIDELPQLLNVLRGEMSLIGPRPCLRYEAEEFDTWQKRRFDTVPGLTGLWQVSGKNRTTFKEMMRLDIGYARKRAFLLDLKIFLKTVPAVVDQVLDRPAFAPVRMRISTFTLYFMSLVFPFIPFGGNRK